MLVFHLYFKIVNANVIGFKCLAKKQLKDHEDDKRDEFSPDWLQQNYNDEFNI